MQAPSARPGTTLTTAIAPWLVALVLFLAPLGATAQPPPVELSLLTYNVHGLESWAVDDDPATRLPEIGRRIDAYDVVLIQENWAWQAALRAGSTHGVILEADPPRSWWRRNLPLLRGSGLELYARSRREDVVEVEDRSFHRCNGWLGAAMDCWASKGYLRARLRLRGGTVVDFWNVHLEAGGDPADHAVRDVQIDALAAAIERSSRGVPLVLGGDLNYLPDAPRLLGFLSRLALRDTGAIGRDPWKPIDRLFVRDGDEIAIEVVEAGPAPDFQLEDGRPLSDHPALRTRLRFLPRPGD